MDMRLGGVAQKKLLGSAISLLEDVQVEGGKPSRPRDVVQRLDGVAPQKSKEERYVQRS